MLQALETSQTIKEAANMVKRVFLRPKKKHVFCYCPWIFGNMFFLNPKSLVFKQLRNVAERPAWRIWMAPPWRRPNLSPAVKRPKGGKFLLLSMLLMLVNYVPSVSSPKIETHRHTFAFLKDGGKHQPDSSI